MRGCNDAGFVFDADNLADDAADGGHLVANGQRVAHLVVLLFLLLLRTNADKIEHSHHQNQHDNHHNGAACAA